MTSTEQFQSVDDKARWRIVYALLAAANTDDVITYEVIADALNLDGLADRAVIQAATRRAGHELERVNSRAIEAVLGVGYRIVQPWETVRLGKQRHRRAGRQIRRGASVVRAGLATETDVEVRKALDVLARGFAVQSEINRRVLTRQQQHADLITSLMERVERLEAGRAER